MRVYAFTTGTVRVTQNWRHGKGAYPLRLIRTLTDPHLTDPLPIWCWLIKASDGLILIDTGIPLNANRPVWFPPHMRLAQRAAPFQITSAEEEIGHQLRANGFSPADVRTVVLTHLHQDHEGGLHHFPSAEFIVSRAEWDAARGFKGRMGGYLNQRWSKQFAPTLIDFDAPDAIFGGRHTLTDSIHLVPTPGHSAGHLSVIVNEGDTSLFFAGDASYTQDLLLMGALDGVSPNARQVHQTHARILTYASRYPTIYLPSHEWEAKTRLQAREILNAQTRA